VPEAVTGAGIPGSDPALVAQQLLERQGVGMAVLVPGMRGLLPNVDLDAELCTATNRWLKETWLGDPRYRGTIRVAAGDPRLATREIERWAGDEAFVQVAVPMQSHQPYGQRRYLPIWEAAAEAGLPVAIHIDGGASIDFHPTPAGYVRYAVEYATLYPLNFAFHLASFVAEGVFDRLPGLKIVFTDGGFDLLAPIVWRLDKDWRPTREDFPWTTSLPSDYLREHVRFCSNGLEGPLDGEGWEDWLNLGDAADLLLFASNYPQRDYDPPGQAFAGVAETLRRRIMGENARELYRL
jgi:predicted TIM-barrel fold metal-dependent hydrolase